MSEPTAILFVIRNYVRLHVITAVKIHIVAFWTDILRSMPGGYQRYGENHASFNFVLETQAANYSHSKRW